MVIDLHLNLEALAAGKLPPQLITPPHLEKALSDLVRQLPSGWELPPGHRDGRIWNVYRDAQVSTARLNGKLRVFAQIPI